MSLSEITRTLSKEKVKQYIIDNFDDFIKLEVRNNDNHAEVELLWKTNQSRQILKSQLLDEYKTADITTGSCNE